MESFTLIDHRTKESTKLAMNLYYTTKLRQDGDKTTLKWRDFSFHITGLFTEELFFSA